MRGAGMPDTFFTALPAPAGDHGRPPGLAAACLRQSRRLGQAPAGPGRQGRKESVSSQRQAALRLDRTSASRYHAGVFPTTETPRPASPAAFRLR